MQFIIGLGHRREVGKDTLAALLKKQIEAFGYHAAHVAFADKLYQICEELFGMHGFKNKAYYDANKEAKGMILRDINKSPREILIEVGNLLRQVCPTVWTDVVFYQGLMRDFTIISDVRYPNEVTEIRRRGGVVYKITRPGIEEFDDVADSALADFDDWDGVVKNDLTIERLDLFAADLARHFVELRKKAAADYSHLWSDPQGINAAPVKAVDSTIISNPFQ